MKNFSTILSSVAVVLAAVALIVATVRPCCKNAPSSAPANVSAEVINTINSNPKIIADAMQSYQIQQQEEQRRAADEALAQFAGEINDSSNAPFIGPKNAKVTVVEFFDFSCGYCKRLAPAMEKVVADNADVKFVFKPLSFVAPISNYQAKAALATFKQGKFVEFYQAALNSNEKMTEASVDELVKSIAGINFDAYKADIASAEVVNNLNAINELAQKIRVSGVPTIIINGKHVQTLDAADLQSAINEGK